MNNEPIRALVSRRSFIKGVGLLSASAALAACSRTGSGQGSGSGQGATDGHASGSSASQPSSASTGSQAAAPLLAIIHTNDTHGHDVAVEGTADVKGNFSIAAVAALKAEWQQKGYDVLLVDAGDATQGMPLVDNSKGAPAIAFMNACGYDLMTVGNHEFDWGIDALAANEQAAEFPFLSANIVNRENGEPRFVPNKTFELSDGTKVGFFGLTTPSTTTTTNPKNVTDIDFLRDDDLRACAQAQVDELREQGCDIVVCLGHLGNAEIGPITSKAVIQGVNGIDLFIDGHDHKEVSQEVDGILLVETGCYLHNIGVVVIDQGAPAPQLVAAGDFDGIDSSVQAIVDAESERADSELAVSLGSTPFLLDGAREPGLRTQETNLGDFCTDALRWTASQELGRQVDACVINGGGLRASVEAGDITLGTVKTVVPFANNLMVLNVTGAQLLEAIEASCQAIGRGKAIGAFPQVAGITFTLDASVPYEEGPTYPDSDYASPASVGARVTISDVGGRGFDEQATYSIACSDFLCDGGDTYYAFKEAALADEPVALGFDYEAIASYLTVACDHEVPAEYAQPQGRITIVGAA